MKPFFQPQALLFDLDGTLIDSWRDLATSVNLTLESLGLKPYPQEEVKNFIGDGMQKLIERALGPAHQVLLQEGMRFFKIHYQAHCLEQTRLYPGVLEGLKSLAPYFRLFVLTNKPEGFSRQILAGLAISSFFEAIIGGDTFPYKKPEPLLFDLLLKTYHLLPKGTWMVGDHHTDLEFAQRVGMPAIFCRYGIGQAQAWPALAEIEHFEELIRLLQ